VGFVFDFAIKLFYNQKREMDDFQGEEKAFVVDEVNGIVKEVHIINQVHRRNHPERFVPPKQSRTMELKYCGTNTKETYRIKQAVQIRRLNLIDQVTCTIMQKNGAGLHSASSCYWDNATDGDIY
jgi:dynein light chain Tctex-type 1